MTCLVCLVTLLRSGAGNGRPRVGVLNTSLVLGQLRLAARSWPWLGLLDAGPAGEQECHQQDAAGGDPGGDQAGAGEAVQERG